MTKQVKVYAGTETFEKWQKVCERFSSNTTAFAVMVEFYYNQMGARFSGETYNGYSDRCTEDTIRIPNEMDQYDTNTSVA